MEQSFRVPRILRATTFGLALLAAMPAAAMPSSFTDASFITVNAGDQLQFTFLGFSAADTDQLRLDGQLIFQNQTASVGQTFNTGPLAAGTYQLTLADLSSGVSFSSDPAQNPDGAHLGVSSNFADFNLGTVSPVGAVGLLYGWEDRPLGPLGTLDYNDLVFTLAVMPRAVAEPGSLLLLGASLVGLGMFRWGRRHGSRSVRDAGPAGAPQDAS
jgi:hypothetical protein